MHVASIFLGRLEASPIEIGKISRRAFAVAALCERRKTAVPAPRGKLQPPLRDGHPQPLEQTVHTSPATLQKELYALMLFTAMPDRAFLTLQGEWLLGVHHRQVARRILVPKSQSGKLATILKGPTTRRRARRSRSMTCGDGANRVRCSPAVPLRAGHRTTRNREGLMKKSIGDNMIPKSWSFEQGLELMKKAGYDGVELC